MVEESCISTECQSLKNTIIAGSEAKGAEAFLKHPWS